MGHFLNSERKRQAAFKQEWPHFTDSARAEGMYRGSLRPFCLPTAYADENLYASIRLPALEYFAHAGIVWHNGQAGNPSNHLCSSQVCCVNFLYPFVDKPEALAVLLRPIFPGLRRVLPIEASNHQYVAFEWIGSENYLGERVPRGGGRTRGANFTSADAMVMFECGDGRQQIVLIEWKYTESYAKNVSKKIARSGTDRSAIYAHLYERTDCALNKTLLKDFDALFYEPFYQFMRQQFLAHEMERAHEFDADVVSLLHIAPAHNVEFGTVTSPALRELGDKVRDVWKRLVREPDRFASVSTEDLFGAFPVRQFPDLADWWDYVGQRYAWVRCRK
jgi:hypothetical protein